ncbi:MAG: zinc transporter ZntB [Marinicellaceae bacterium]
MTKKSSIESFFLNSKGEQLKQDEEGCINWYNFSYTSDAARKWLKKQPEISIQAQNILLAADNRPRLIEEDNSIIMCLRGINLNKTDDPEDMITIRIWMSNQTILTSCARGSQSIRNIQNLIVNNNGPKSVAELLIMLIEQLAHITDEFVDSIDQMLDQEEDSIAENTFEMFNPKMSKIRRQIATIRRFLAPQKEALEKLYRCKLAKLNEELTDNLYIQIDKFIYILENLDLLRERALVLQEQFNAYISQQQNSRLYLLAIISAIFLPLTFLSGLLGMNVGGIPGIETASAFWIVVIFCVIVTAFLLILFKKSRWF